VFISNAKGQVRKLKISSRRSMLIFLRKKAAQMGSLLINDSDKRNKWLH